MRVTADQFVDGAYGGAKGKAATCNAIIRFIESNFAREKFTKMVYSGGLMYMFGHIAHYNAGGFYATWFEDDFDRLNWLEYVQRGGMYGSLFGGEDCTLVEVERIIQKYVNDSGLVETYRQHCADVTEAREKAQLAALKAKYEGSN